jgi:hypothetical protein
MAKLKGNPWGVEAIRVEVVPGQGAAVSLSTANIISGVSTPNANIRAVGKDNGVLATGVSDGQGRYEILIPMAKLKGNPWGVEAIRVEVVPGQGAAVSLSTANVISGVSTPNANIRAVGKDNEILATGVSDGQGRYEITIPMAKLKGNPWGVEAVRVKVVLEDRSSMITSQFSTKPGIDQPDREDILLELIKINSLKIRNVASETPTKKTEPQDFDFFLNLKNTLILEKSLLFEQFYKFKTSEDIVRNESALVDFLITYSKDYETLIEFANLSFRNEVQSKLDIFLTKKYNFLFVFESQIKKFQKKFFFSTLDPQEFKSILRVFIFKNIPSISDVKTYKYSGLTLNFLEMLSENRGLNFRQLANLSSQNIVSSPVKKSIKLGINIFIGKNKLDYVKVAVQEEQYYKNLFFSFLKFKKIPEWSQSRSIDVEDSIAFIKAVIDKEDVAYIRELFSDKVIVRRIVTHLKKVDPSIRLKLLGLLKLPYIEHKIDDVYQGFLKAYDIGNFDTQKIFETIIIEELWKVSSLLAIYERMYRVSKIASSPGKIKIINSIEGQYPDFDILIKKTNIVTEKQKIELIRYFIQNGKLPSKLEVKSQATMQLITSHLSKKPSLLLFLLQEFSKSPSISKNIVTLVSTRLLVESIIESIGRKDQVLKELLLLFLIPIPKEASPTELTLYDTLIVNWVSPKIITIQNFKSTLNQINEISPTYFNMAISSLEKVRSNQNISIKRSVVVSYFKELKDSEQLITSKLNTIPQAKSETLDFEDFMYDLKYFINFKSFDRSKKTKKIKEFYVLFYKYRYHVSLKQEIHMLAKSHQKSVSLLQLFPEKKGVKILDIIHPKLLVRIKLLNSILAKFNYDSVQKVLNLDSDKKFLLKILQIWSTKNVIVYNPNEIVYSLLEDAISFSSLAAVEVLEKLAEGLPTLEIEERKLVNFILLDAIHNVRPREIIEIPEKSPLFLEEDAIYINNAGLILVWPFISTLFNKLGLLIDNSFIDDYNCQKAILLLNFFVFDDKQIEESDLVLNKILCGVDLNYYVDVTLELSDIEKNICASLINAVKMNWEKMSGTSTTTFKDYFLKREGFINKNNNDFSLNVERRPHDLLLETVPWNISMIQTSFMKNRLLVNWKDKK